MKKRAVPARSTTFFYCFTIIFGLFLMLLGCSERPADKKPEFRSIDLTGADYANDFALPDTQGQTKTLADFKGKVTLVFFGFTQCPDVCPTTMAEAAQVKKMLGAQGDKVTAVFITLDPERDTREVLQAYMQSFDTSFTALRGSPEQTAQLAKNFKVFYKKVEGKSASSYSFDHTAASFVYDPQGRLRLYTRYGMGAQALAEDIKLLLKP